MHDGVPLGRKGSVVTREERHKRTGELSEGFVRACEGEEYSIHPSKYKEERHGRT